MYYVYLNAVVYPVYHIRLIANMIFANMYSVIIEFWETQFRDIGWQVRIQLESH